VQRFGETPMVDQISVLVVEDEAILRIRVACDLEDAGFIILEASHADEAINLLLINPQIQVLFTDVDMPGSMDGLKLAVAVRDRWPPIKIIVTSGYRRLNKETLPVEGEFLIKPYTPNHVIQTIKSLVDA
jgi:two-component system, response regulator PdtaR